MNTTAGPDSQPTGYQPPRIPGHARWGRTPTHHNGDYVVPGRAVLVLAGHTWPHQPETCPNDTGRGQWHGEVLTCPDCGLDET